MINPDPNWLERLIQESDQVGALALRTAVDTAVAEGRPISSMIATDAVVLLLAAAWTMAKGAHAVVDDAKSFYVPLLRSHADAVESLA